jgi:hypothetical protein
MRRREFITILGGAARVGVYGTRARAAKGDRCSGQRIFWGIPWRRGCFHPRTKEHRLIVDRMMARKLGALTACPIKFKSEVETTG